MLCKILLCSPSIVEEFIFTRTFSEFYLCTISSHVDYGAR